MTNQEIDYKELLKKYMSVISYAEGCDYLCFVEEAVSKSEDGLCFSDEEIKELCRIAKGGD